jgi:hypothetical protein
LSHVGLFDWSHLQSIFPLSRHSDSPLPRHHRDRTSIE